MWWTLFGCALTFTDWGKCWHSTQSHRMTIIYTESSKVCFKAALLNNRNKVAFNTYGQLYWCEPEDGMSFVLNAVKYKEHCWQLSDVLKTAMLLLELLQKFMTYCCFLWLWSSWVTDSHCVIKNWKVSGEFLFGKRHTENIS